MQSARGFEYGVRHIISLQSGAASSVTADLLNIPSEDVSFLLRMGAIYLNHERLTADAEIKVDDYLRVHTKPRRFLPNDQRWSERIVFANENFAIVNKPSGLPVHASVDNIMEHTQAYLEAELQQPVYGTHRLDVATEGLIVFAKTPQFRREFNKLLIAREVDKVYRAQVQGAPPQRGLITHYMEPSPRAPKRVDLQPHEGWQECLLEILETHPSLEHSELRIRLHTGRTHQIRAQLSALGFPIVGDTAYGGIEIPREFEKIHLQAQELTFKDPLSGVDHHFKAPAPLWSCHSK